VSGPPGGGPQQLTIFDRKGGAEALKIPPGAYFFPRVSPDGKRLAFESTDGKESFIAVYDLLGMVITVSFGSRSTVASRDASPTPARGTSHMPEAWSPIEDVLLFNASGQ
jgi:Tol biopolymer transport system component